MVVDNIVLNNINSYGFRHQRVEHYRERHGGSDDELITYIQGYHVVDCAHKHAAEASKPDQLAAHWPLCESFVFLLPHIRDLHQYEGECGEETTEGGD